MSDMEKQQENIIIDDFKRTTDKRKKKKFRHKNQDSMSGWMEDNRQVLILFGVMILALACVLVSILGLKVAVVPVCVIIVLEALLAVCLHDVPIWLHAIVVVIQVVAGILCASVVFMILNSILYIAGIMTLKYMRD